MVILGCFIELLVQFFEARGPKKRRMSNPLTHRVKSWVIQSFLTFDSMVRTLKCDHSLDSC